MQSAALLAALMDAGLDKAALPSGPQLDLVVDFASLYEERGLLINGHAPSLWKCCPNADSCWAGALETRPNDWEGDGNISLPWVGPGYRPGGVLLVGMNFNDASGLAAAFQIAEGDRQAFQAGHRRVDYGDASYGGTMFPYRSTRSAASILNHLDGVAVEDQEDPVALVSTLDRVVRLQTVKCSPRNTKRSEATNAMWENCPPLLLEEELRRARPGVVVGFGDDVQWAFRRLAGFQPADGSPNLMVGLLTSAGHQIRLYGLAHPLRGGAWQAGQNELVTLLN